MRANMRLGVLFVNPPHSVVLTV